MNRTQQLDFVSQVLPALFHDSPQQFMYYLNRDGNKLLRFYWDEVGKRLDEEQRENYYGLNYEFRKPDPKKTVILIRLPEPQVPDEAYFAALVYRPNRISAFSLVNDATKMIALEHMLDENQQPATRLVEWTRHLERVEIGPGPKPVVADFYEAVMNLIEEKRRHVPRPTSFKSFWQRLQG